MKSHLLFIVIIFISLNGFSQSKSELHAIIEKLSAENKELKEENQKLRDDYSELKKEIDFLKIDLQTCNDQRDKLINALSPENNASNSNPAIVTQNSNKSQPSNGRCQAITSKGTQCTRNSEPGSNYCWQHKGTYEPSSTTTSNSNKAAVSPSKNSGTSTSGGRTIYTGPRGGKYYINSKGNKTYVK
jgi:colicin import membrane protein